MSAGLGQILRETRESKGFTIAGLARELRISAAAISQWEHGRTLPTPSNLVLICDKLGLEAFDMLPHYPEFVREEYPEEFGLQGVRVGAVSSIGNFEIRNIGDKETVIPHKEIKQSNLPEMLARDIPVYGITVAGDRDHNADFTFNGSEIDRAYRPIGLANKKDIFALYVANDSMYPAWREGTLVFVSPHRPAAIGDDVILELHRVKGEEFSRSYLKRLVARTSEKITVEQFNPKQELEFDKSTVKRILRVVPYEEAVGLIS